MFIVGERINTSRKNIREAVLRRDAKFIQEEARQQVLAGASCLDVNAGTSVKTEVDDLCWLVETVQAVSDLPLAIDSANPQASRAALKKHRGRALVNSITAEKSRLEAFLPLVRDYDTLIVALTMDDAGMPDDVEGRLRLTRTLRKHLQKAGVPDERMYFDLLVRPVAVEAVQAIRGIEALRLVKEEFPKVNLICGLSNVSFGLPARNILNRTFLALAMGAGLDAAILDPVEPHMMATVYAVEAILGKDEFCMRYISAAREGKLS